MANNYTLGRSELHFGQFKPNTQTPRGELYFGNTTEISITAEQENLDHYSSDRGVRIKDESVLLQLDYSGSFTTDNISPDNLSYFFLGEKYTTTDTLTTVTAEVHDDVEQGRSYQLGTSSSFPAGARLVASVVVKDDATPTPATFVAGTDYVVDLDLGRITILEGGGIADGTNLRIDYSVSAGSRSRVVSRAATIEGSLRIIAYNPAGAQLDYFMPWVKLTPNGDFQLKADEWQAIPFTMEILKKGSLEAIYIDGRKFA